MPSYLLYIFSQPIPPSFSWLVYFFSVVYFALVTYAIFKIISDDRDPVSALSWVIVIILLPVAGFFIYLIFGQNYRKSKIFKRKLDEDSAQVESLLLEQRYQVGSPFFVNRDEVDINKDTITLLLNSSRSPLTHGNSVEVLIDGEQTFDSIIAAIRGAKKFIHMEYYMIYDDMIGSRIANLLMDRADHGVEVRIIYDDVGSWGLSKSSRERMQRSGIEIYPFMPVRFHRFTSKINYRNHRKIIVVDGKVAFTGGVNIADKYLIGVPKLGRWRDTHLRIEGDAVTALHAIFYNDWCFVSDRALDDHMRYFPKCETEGDVSVQIASSGPDSNWASIMQGFFSAISKAKNHIYISSPYFMPNEPILTAIKVASLSGIDVSILLPKRSDSKIVLWATCSYIAELLDAGVNIYLYTQGFVHSKVITIDGVFSSVGSANMDIRSFEDNFEVSAMIYDRGVTSTLERQFLEDISSSEKIDREQWADRPMSRVVKERLARLFSPLL